MLAGLGFHVGVELADVPRVVGIRKEALRKQLDEAMEQVTVAVVGGLHHMVVRDARARRWARHGLLLPSLLGCGASRWPRSGCTSA